MTKGDRESKPRRKDTLKADNTMRRAICDFARDHGFVIHPGKGYDYYIESFNMFNACPCDKTRKSCPCEEAVTEVPEKGSCLCRLFWQDMDTFEEKMLGG